MNIYKLLLELIAMRIQAAPFYRVVASVGDAMRECEDAIAKANTSGDADYLDLVVDEECGVVENLLGAAFVVCQAELAPVVSNAMRIQADARAQGHNLTASDGTKNGILAIGSSFVPGTTFTHVQAINAFANYFKHCEEWDKPWPQSTGREKQTIDIISACGAQQYSTGNLRKGAKTLGITDCKQLAPLSNHVSAWAKAVKDVHESELKRCHLL